MNRIRRIYVEKRKGFDIEAQNLFTDLVDNLKIANLEQLRVVNRYDIAGISDEEYCVARRTIFGEPPVDLIYDQKLPLAEDERAFAVTYLPGQFDQRADSAAQCLQILTQREQPVVHTAKVLVLRGMISDHDLARVKRYCINPVDSVEADWHEPETLETACLVPEDISTLGGFNKLTDAGLQALHEQMGLAMSRENLCFCRSYFSETEKREPTVTELKVIDTYWSDHCRHTTFLAAIEAVSFAEGQFLDPVREAYREYLLSRESLYKDVPSDISLMDIALIGMKELRSRGLLTDLEESEEINACCIEINVDVDGREEPWLLMFKNETHNHPTEIEPFGGAATCLGGAIRDPLSGRSYVYQAMRVTGSADPRAEIEETIPGKLPQRKITTEAAAGFSAYGNQIGLATGQVAELYDEGFLAKRMEIGFVIGAAPRRNVRRQTPAPGDVIILVGGRTGRDGCGGATGSSKEHNTESLISCGAEVQKGNPPTERKIQRLFRDPRVSALIKKCNDCGAGGVSVAIGELTDGVEIDLDTLPKKYEGLDGTELAISESQERMAVVVAAADQESFHLLARAENLESTQVGQVIAERRLKMLWRGDLIVDLSRDFLNTNGVRQKVSVHLSAPAPGSNYFSALPVAVAEALPNIRQAWLANFSDLNLCSQKGLVERFDSTIGAATVLMPFGGKYQATPVEGAAALLPLLNGETRTATLTTFGYNPQLARWSPFHGALYAVLEAVTKIVALGGDYRTIRLSLQEYFEKLGSDPARWGKPFSALLGAYYAQKMLAIPAIGGKDSMSGTFMDLNVPPTLVAFAVNVVKKERIISPEFKQAGSKVVLVQAQRDAGELPDFAKLKNNFDRIATLRQEGLILAAHAVRNGGSAAAISRMCFGNGLGAILTAEINPESYFRPEYGSLILEIKAEADLSAIFGDTSFLELGVTTAEAAITVSGAKIPLAELYAAWERPLAKVFPTHTDQPSPKPRLVQFTERNLRRPYLRLARPRVFIPVFPGTNCEYDSARAFSRAGALVDTAVMRNLTTAELNYSIGEMAGRIAQAQIVVFCGGFSAGDEPEGSGKFIAAVFRSARLREAVLDLLKTRGGLILGICNGFQALIKLGLLPYGEVTGLNEQSPTLTFNKIGRHISSIARIRVASTLSPWFANAHVGDIYTVAVSHGEGRFVAGEEVLTALLQNGQVATQYVDLAGAPARDMPYNPNGSAEAIEGLSSPDGRVLGCMGHPERLLPGLAINVPGDKKQNIFAAGVSYFQ